MPLDDPWLPESLTLARPATPIAVARYDPDNGASAYEWLDNVVCVTITDGLGTDPGMARLRYRFTGLDANAPQSAEEALDSSHHGGKLIVEGDRIVVLAQEPGGTWGPIFDGYALTFELGINPRQETVSIVCVGVAVRNQDYPMGGMVFRDQNNLIDGKDRQIDEVAHFNPRGVGNCLPRNAKRLREDEDRDKSLPTFCDPANKGSVADPGPDDLPRFWELPDAAAYLAWWGNYSETWTKNPTVTELEATLVTKEPKEGAFYDPDDPSTFDVTPIVVPDKPITGKDWPSALREMVAGKGFETRWSLAAVGTSPYTPETTLRIFNTQTTEVKDLWLQPRGSALDLTLTNLGEAGISRSLVDVINAWQVRGELEEFEVSFVLACGFPSESADAGTLTKYRKDDPTFLGENHDKYRLFLFDEAGEGHYLPNAATLLTDVPSLDKALGAPRVINDEDVPRYVNRRRPPIGQLISTDARDVPLKWRLSISTDYTGDCPAVWDGAATSAGTWKPVQGGFQLLKDRIGVFFDGEDPNAWQTGLDDNQKVVRIVQSLATPTTTNPKFWLRLTCVIRGDERTSGLAYETRNSPLPNRQIIRYVDAHDRYKTQTIVKGSELLATAEENQVVRDDSNHALAEATAMQLATQNGVLGGSVVIPRFTRYYEPGDRLRSIQGRGLGLRTDSGGADAAPTYPVVVSRTHHLEGRQVTVLELSDANPNRSRYAGRHKGKGRGRYG